MYEPEVNAAVGSIENLPADSRKRFAEYRDQVTSRTTLPWGEHCTECVWPACYTTCELYDRRADGACRQFVDGVVRFDHADGLNPYVLQIAFKQWAKLWTVGNLQLKSPADALQKERRHIFIGAAGRLLPLPGTIKPRLLTKINYRRRIEAEHAAATAKRPDAFLLECYNPNPRELALTFTVRTALPQVRQFQTRIALPPGYTRARVPFADITKLVDLSGPFEVEVVPNDCENTTLFFGMMDFVTERRAVAEPSKDITTPSGQWKGIVWDLDNTLWDGTLIEDGPEKIRVRPKVVAIIKQADERGIVHSIASKNNHDDAMAVLKAHGLDEYFLYPQISWRHKSEAVSNIAKLLNIGVETLAFVDDQPFELEEVRSAQPKVSVVDARDVLTLLDRPEMQVPVTAEARRRRLMYREQEQRQIALDSNGGDYLGFLRECKFEALITPLTEHSLRRVYELAQRTNQLNFSGTRYSESVLTEMLTSDRVETFVIDCNDRFGSYGIVGFAVVDVREPRLVDLMFSCRVQAKRVEHAIIGHLMQRFRDRGAGDFFANYRRTAKNGGCGMVFDDMGFELAKEADGVATFVFKASRQIVDERVVDINSSLPERRDLSLTHEV